MKTNNKNRFFRDFSFFVYRYSPESFKGGYKMDTTKNELSLDEILAIPLKKVTSEEETKAKLIYITPCKYCKRIHCRCSE